MSDCLVIFLLMDEIFLYIIGWKGRVYWLICRFRLVILYMYYVVLDWIINKGIYNYVFLIKYKRYII